VGVVLSVRGDPSAGRGVSETEAFRSLAFVVGVAALTPIVLGLVPRLRLPEVVVLLAAGMAIGPHGADLAQAGQSLTFVSQLGLGMLFLLAGIEVDPPRLRNRDGTRALAAWCISLVVALGWVFLLAQVVEINARVAVAIAMTSTAFGTLLPVLRDSGLQRHRMGDLVLANGAVGEFGPILAMSVFLTQGSAWGGLLSLLAFGVIAAGLGFLLVRHSPRAERIVDVIRRGADTTAQAPVRLMVLMLAVMLAASASLGLDVILGAFVAGAIVRMLLPADPEEFLSRLDGVGYGFLIPVFFVVSGMGIDPAVFVERPGTVLFVFASILLLRGGPVLLLNRHLQARERLQLSLFSATGLPIIVAVTTVAVASGQMSHRGQSIVVAAGMLTVLVLPVLAVTLHRSEPAEAGSR
jgi:Kef-type K+ transport system membrane component KefB